MPQDLRNQEFKPWKPPKGAANPGCAGGLISLVCVVFIVIGVLMLAMGAGVFAVVWIIIAVSILFNSQKQTKQAAEKGVPAGRPVSRPPASAAPRRDQEPCPNPEPHRHYEQQKPCPNPEPHRHYEAARPAAAKTYAQPSRAKQYDTFVQPVKRWPTDAERRLENMKNLYDAGLLTREEYDDEVRRIKRG